MKTRAFEERDRQALKSIHAKAGYDFVFPDDLSTYTVVVDELDAPLMAGGYKLVPEVTLLCAPGGAIHPLMKLRGIELLHKSLHDTLTAKGFREAFAWIPPQLAAYSRHLRRRFGWQQCWPALRIRDDER